MSVNDQTPPRDRIEPRTDWDKVRFRDETRNYDDYDASPYAVPAWRSRRVWRWTALGIGALVVLLVVFRQPLAGVFWPDTRIQQLLNQGDAALRIGQLSASGGRGARQYYEAALALDSDRSEAREGLARVAAAALVQAREFSERKQYDRARDALALANELQVPRAEAVQVAESLHQREAGGADIEPLLQQALAAQKAGRLDGAPDAALPLFQRVLSLQPGRIEALEGREDALTDLLQQAQALLAKGEVAQAGEVIAKVRSYDPGHVDLPAAQAALARGGDSGLKRADEDLRARRLEAARKGYEDVLSTSPEDARARQGLDRVASAYAEQSRRKAADFEFDAAEAALAQAREVSPQSPAINEAEQALSRARASEASLDKRASPRQRGQRLQDLITGIGQAEARNDWMTPPGESVYDQLRAAQALAPDDARVKAAAARFLPAVTRCFEDELRGNRLRRAQACLSAWQTVKPADPGLMEARRQMAQKWIAVGGERLSAGDVGFATQALSEARALAPRAPGLDEFAERVRMARSSAP